MSLSQRKAGVLFGYTNIVVKNLVNLVYTPMLLAFVGQADYGVYQTSNSFVFTLSLLSFGFSGAYVRFYTQRKISGVDADIRKLNGMYLILYTCICNAALIIGLVFAANAGFFFSEGFTGDQIALARTLLSIMAFNIAITLFSTTFDAYILVCERFKFQQSRQMFTTLATPVIAFFLLNLGMGAVGVALSQLVVTLVLLGLNIRFAVLKLGMRFDFKKLDGTLFRSIVTFSMWVFINQICELVNQNIPNILLGAVSGAAVVAVFAVSLQIRNVFYSLSATISNVFVPRVNRIVTESNSNSELTALMTRVGRYQMVLYCWILGGFAVLGKWFIEAWAGESFHDAYWLVLAMIIPLAIPLVQNVGIEIQKARNMHHARSVMYLVMAILNLVLTIALAPRFGYWAPVIGFDAYVLVGCGLFMNWYYQRRMGLDMLFFWRKILPVGGACAVATCACLAGTSLVSVSCVVLFLGWGMVYTLIYGTATWFIVFDKRERTSLMDKAKRGISI